MTLDRQRQLQRLHKDISRLGEDIGKVRGETRQLCDLELVRALTPAEATRATTIRRESERLRQELEQLRAAFARLQDRNSSKSRVEQW